MHLVGLRRRRQEENGLVLSDEQEWYHGNKPFRLLSFSGTGGFLLCIDHSEDSRCACNQLAERVLTDCNKNA